mgnify:CR=1 FL=1
MLIMETNKNKNMSAPFKMKGMDFGNSPIEKKLPIDRSKDFDVDFNQTLGNKELIKEMEGKYKAGKITKKELNEAKKQINSYEDR